MSSSMKFVKHPSFPQANAFLLPSQWFWKMTVREWAFAQLDIVDGVPINPRFTGATNNMRVIRSITLAKSPDPKKVTIKFYAHSAGNAYVYLHDPTIADPFAPVEKIQMQVEVQTRRSGSESGISLTKLEGTTAAVNAPDTISYEMSSTEVFRANDPLALFKSIPAGANHVVVASHGIVVGQNTCMFAGGATKPSLRLGLDNCEVVFATLKGKVATNCVVWLGGCGIGSNNEFCSKAAKASGCPVIAAGHVLVNKKFPKDFVDILDKVSMPKLFMPGQSQPGDIGDFCSRQEMHKFVVPV
jgi:hypothetical protein